VPVAQFGELGHALLLALAPRGDLRGERGDLVGLSPRQRGLMFGAPGQLRQLRRLPREPLARDRDLAAQSPEHRQQSDRSEPRDDDRQDQLPADRAVVRQQRRGDDVYSETAGESDYGDQRPSRRRRRVNWGSSHDPPCTIAVLATWF